MEAVVVMSGGMDSSTLLYDVLAHTPAREVLAVSFNYGQRHNKELQYARHLCETKGVAWQLVDLYALGRLLSGSSLTDKAVDVPDGHYAEETMKATVVPNRNAIMISIAWGIAVAKGAGALYVGVHAGDHFIYPDCRPDFIEALSHTLSLGNRGFGDPNLHISAPYIHWTKAEIAGFGSKIGVPYALTWSCYKGGDLHCGKCGTCIERREAFMIAGVPDPTKYESEEAIPSAPVTQ